MRSRARNALRKKFHPNGVNMSCRVVLTEATAACGRPNTSADEYRRCMAARGVQIEEGPDAACPVGATPCRLSSESATFCARVDGGSATPQTVHAVGGHYGGPSRLVTDGGKSR